MLLDGFDKTEPLCSCVFESESEEPPVRCNRLSSYVYLPVGENGKRLGRIPFSCIPRTQEGGYLHRVFVKKPISFCVSSKIKGARVSDLPNESDTLLSSSAAPHSTLPNGRLTR